jgi:hypothetical protein
MRAVTDQSPRRLHAKRGRRGQLLFSPTLPAHLIPSRVNDVSLLAPVERHVLNAAAGAPEWIDRIDRYAFAQLRREVEELKAAAKEKKQ